MNRADELYFGALLHDLGKLFQRAGASGVHEKIGAETVLSVMKNVPPGVSDIIGHHHERTLAAAQLHEDSLAYIVCEADNIAAGADRRDAVEEAGTGGFKADIPLHCVLNCIGGGEKRAYRLRRRDPRATAETPVPTKAELIAAGRDKYEQIAENLKELLNSIDLERCEKNRLSGYLRSAMSFVPSSTDVGEIPDISLYSHSKLTAAIALCIYRFCEEQGITDYKKLCLTSKAATRKKNLFRMVSLDMSGIQRFIYTIRTENAAKSLKARSFALELYMEHVIDSLLELTGTERTNLIYSGGGHCYLLLPNTERTTAALSAVKKDVNDCFIEKYSTALYLAAADAECSASVIMGGDGGISGVFAALSAGLSADKLKRYDREQLDRLIHVPPTFTADRECAVCGVSDKSVELRDGSYKCRGCEELEGTGAELGRIYADRVSEKKRNSAVIVSERRFGASFELPSIQGRRYYADIAEFDPALEHKRVYSVNTGLTVFDSIELNTGDYRYTKDGALFTYGEYAKMSVGVERLGVLRADVDDLGRLFARGFDDKRLNTLSRSETLSELLSSFFKETVNRVAAGNLKTTEGKPVESFSLGVSREGGRRMSICYSGGDDLLAVGAWNDVLEFAVELRRMFESCCGGKLSFSAGFGMFDPHFPLSKMADITGRLEDRAKTAEGKDSICLFSAEGEGCVYKWRVFADKVCGEKLGSLYRWIDPQDSSKLAMGTSGLYSLLGLLTAKEMNMAKVAYFTARAKRCAQSEQAMKRYDEFRRCIMKWALEEREQLITAITLYVYSNRERREGER